MNFTTYRRWNTIVGWIVFAIAAFTYLNTMELTVSLWDCGEFVSCDYKMEVPHPPGAPMYVLIYRMFTMFAGHNGPLAAILANSASALASAFTILFLFWTISELALRLVIKDENNIAKGDLYAVLGAAAVGALAYTFSDTFWFSAVEAEVYAMSSMFTALVFWLALKWERRAGEGDHLRWMVLIFYLTGVVIGIHLLGLLVLPVIVLMYYFRKYQNITWKGTLIAAVIGFAVLGIVQVGVIQWLPSIAAWVDLHFVNDFGLPFWSGVIFFFAVVFIVCGYFIWRTHVKKMVMLNTALVCFAMVTMGYLSYGATIIRSFANPSIDMNNPEDVFAFIGYVSREQYGENYIVTGPYYNAYNAPGGLSYEANGTDWRRFGKQYVEAGVKVKTNFNDKYTTVFPRMFNGTQPNYIQGYRYWGNIKQTGVNPQTGRPMYQDENPDFRPSFVKNNLRFFFNYQINYMYWRYFAWNFIGRQNDIQGMMNEFTNGNWITGIGPVDQALGNGPQSNLPDYLEKNRARNKLFALPFILGLIGMAYQYRRRRREFGVIFLFFFMTGLAIELYLNMPSPQPRERDYAFVGSFYVFAIWIGIGVLYFYDLLKKRTSMEGAAIISTVVCLVAVPTLMAAQEWDDHDRSNRTASRDYGVNYLESCAKGAVLFTNGDNDTYPLWYAQEVEGIRDDIRIINLSLFSTDWYVNQMRVPINHAPALKFSLTEEQMFGWDLGYHDEDKAKAMGIAPNQYFSLQDVLKFIGNRSNFLSGSIQTIPFVPTRNFFLPVDREHVKKLGFIPASDTSHIVDTIKFSLGSKTNFMKSDIMLLDFIATNNWDVPIYFSATSGPDDYLNLTDYLQQEGLCYRLVPVKRTTAGSREIPPATDIMYNNVMKKFRWGDVDKNTTLVDFQLSHSAESLRNVFLRLAYQLMQDGKKDKAIAATDKCLAVIPERNVPYNYYQAGFVEVYLRCGAMDKGKKLGEHLADLYIKELNYFADVYRKNKSMWSSAQQETYGDISELTRIYQLADEFKITDLAKRLKPQVDKFQDPMLFPAPQQ
jgi:hypothetical protein